MPYSGRVSFTAAFQQGLFEGIRSLDGQFISVHEEWGCDSISKSHPHDLIHRARYAPRRVSENTAVKSWVRDLVT